MASVARGVAIGLGNDSHYTSGLTKLYVMYCGETPVYWPIKLQNCNSKWELVSTAIITFNSNREKPLTMSVSTFGSVQQITCQPDEILPSLGHQQALCIGKSVHSDHTFGKMMMLLLDICRHLWISSK